MWDGGVEIKGFSFTITVSGGSIFAAQVYLNTTGRFSQRLRSRDGPTRSGSVAILLYSEPVLKIKKAA